MTKLFFERAPTLRAPLAFLGAFVLFFDVRCLEAVVARAEITRIQASKLSLMPEGLEEGLTQQDVADLMDFLFAQSQ